MKTRFLIENKGKCMSDRVLLYIRYAVDHLKFSDETREYAEYFAKELRGDDFTIGKNPRTMAAGIVYLSSLLSGEIAGGKTATQWRVAQVLDTNELSVRKHFQDIAEKFGVGAMTVEHIKTKISKPCICGHLKTWHRYLNANDGCRECSCKSYIEVWRGRPYGG